MDNKLATQQFRTLAQLFQQDPDGVDLILDVAAEAMQSRNFSLDCGLPEALRKEVSVCLDISIDLNCNACLHNLRLTQGRNAEEILADLTAEQIEAARLEQIEKADGNEHRIALINKSFEYITKQYPAAFAALKVLQGQGWLSDPGADLPEEQESEELQAVAA
jgi:hypothetical protein